MARAEYYYNVNTRREAQLFIEQSIERGLTVMTVYGLARDTYNTTNDKYTRKGARLILSEMDHQRQMSKPLSLIGGAFAICVVAYIVLMFMYGLG